MFEKLRLMIERGDLSEIQILLGSSPEAQAAIRYITNTTMQIAKMGQLEILPAQELLDAQAALIVSSPIIQAFCLALKRNRESIADHLLKTIPALSYYAQTIANDAAAVGDFATIKCLSDITNPPYQNALIISWDTTCTRADEHGHHPISKYLQTNGKVTALSRMLYFIDRYFLYHDDDDNVLFNRVVTEFLDTNPPEADLVARYNAILFAACDRNQPELVRRLLRSPVVRANAAINDTALSSSAEYGWDDILGDLLTIPTVHAKFDDWIKTGATGHPFGENALLRLAVQNGRTNVSRQLLGIPVVLEHLVIRDNDVFYDAARYGWSTIARRLLQEPCVLNWFQTQDIHNLEAFLLDILKCAYMLDYDDRIAPVGSAIWKKARQHGTRTQGQESLPSQRDYYRVAEKNRGHMANEEWSAVWKNEAEAGNPNPRVLSYYRHFLFLILQATYIRPGLALPAIPKVLRAINHAGSTSTFFDKQSSSEDALHGVISACPLPPVLIAMVLEYADAAFETIPDILFSPPTSSSSSSGSGGTPLTWTAPTCTTAVTAIAATAATASTALVTGSTAVHHSHR